MHYSRTPLLTLLLACALSPPTAHAVTITFETRPDGTPIIDQGGPNCGEITFETFRAWGVLFTPPEGDVLNIRNSLECLSADNALCACSRDGTIIMTFVLPGTNTSTVVDVIDLAALTATTLPWVAQVHVYDAQGLLLDYWALTYLGFCREPPFYYDLYHFSAPGRIARVECYLHFTAIDDVVVTEPSTPVEGSTWGRIKALYP